MPSLIFIVGPTACGKTELAFQWAKKDPGLFLINSDSIQAYKELNIGSAKPDFTLYPRVRHYLFDEISAPKVWTAGDFRRKALKILKQEPPSATALVVGGSGFYIQALEKGMYSVPPISREQKKKWEKLEEEKGLDTLYQLLKKKDPLAGKQISSKDRYRIIRSLCLMETSGKSLSQIKAEFREQKPSRPYFKVGLSLPKDELLKRVERRVQAMLKKGLIEEIEALVNKGLRHWRPLSSLGYKEGLLYLDGKIKKEELGPAIVSGTMRLAKKQKTWFKRDKNIKWLSAEKTPLEIYKELFK